jgi:hypothetical protein
MCVLFRLEPVHHWCTAEDCREKQLHLEEDPKLQPQIGSSEPAWPTCRLSEIRVQHIPNRVAALDPQALP